MDTIRALVDEYEELRAEQHQRRREIQDELDQIAMDMGLHGDWEVTAEDDSRNRQRRAGLAPDYSEEIWERTRWMGREIPQEDAGNFYAAFDDEEMSTKEHISGGRFEVVEVADDPHGIYGKVIKIRQVGVFDPQNPGTLIVSPNRRK